MTEERPTGDRPDEEDRVPLPGGEYVGRAQPMDPARRRGPAPAAADAESPAPPAREPAAPPAPEQEPDARPPAPRPPGGRQSSSRRVRAASARGAVDRVRRADFPVVLRGYDRAAVDAYVADVAQLVAELEATQLPESVVQRALDDVGDETSAILKRAHEAGEEITSRSRSQAEGRLEAAEREADLIRSEAEGQVRKLEEDIQAIWRERQRLIDDVRTLADDVLGLADDAMERIPTPGGGDTDGEESSPSGDAPEDALDPLEERDPAEPADDQDASRLALAAGAPLGLAPQPDEALAQGDDDADDETIEERPEDEDTAERPSSA
jgi:cell division initiation protein